MERIENKIVKVNSEEVEIIEQLGEYFIDIKNDGSYRYDVAHASLYKVENEAGNVYFEIACHDTYGVDFTEKVTEYNIDFFEDTWLAEDQKGGTYYDSIFFKEEKDAIDYLKMVLRAHESFEEAVRASGLIE
ncbi:hypothetical protein [Staphylococcus americanisciuri]|uniref:Uncharacterized protein n=1 Tax=Staphylococcus americanisciuri TaxID=2973940 RepID=A0ABT2F3W3_9STAP|nr:hypothetical protein [Staphylococcus americanisciuri]MCS4487171.1 hypothetical protein [Staphylococcus americanisciuri]